MLAAAVVSILLAAPAFGAYDVRRLKDIQPGPADSTLFSSPGGSPSAVFFAADNGVNGSELWVTDGTPAGTTLFKDLNPGAPASTPSEWVLFGGRMYFAATDSVAGRELWGTDGTAAGTQIFKNINPTGGSSPNQLTATQNGLFFAADDGTNGQELWRGDGSVEGTQMVQDLAPGGLDSSPVYLAAGNSGGQPVYFSASGPLGEEPYWSSGGSVNLLENINPTTVPFIQGSNPTGFVPFGQDVYFSANDGTNGRELWKGTTSSGASLVKNINTSSLSSDPDAFTAFGGKLYFSADTPGSGRELWVTDGTEPNTVQVKNINAGINAGSGPFGFTELNGKLYFSATSGSGITSVGQRELWVTDGTGTGTQQVININPAASSNPAGITRLGGRLYFSADDGVHGKELWSTDGTAAGTRLEKDIDPGPGSGDPFNFSVVGGRLLFAATDPAAGRELWAAGDFPDPPVKPPPVTPPVTPVVPAAKAPCAGLKGKRLATCKLNRKIKRQCGRIKNKRKRKLCAKRLRALAKCDRIKTRTKQGKARKRACVKRAKAIGRPKRKRVA